MAMRNGISYASVIVGLLLSVVTVVSAICGGLAIETVNVVEASVGLWGLYFAVPGGISILAGIRKQKNLLAVALGTHILGIVLGIVGAITAAAFWLITAKNCFTTPEYPDTYQNFKYLPGHCYCPNNNKLYTYPADCTDLDTVRSATATVTITFAIASIICLIGSIQGCIGTCCAPKEPTVIITTAEQPNTMGMSVQPAY